MYMTKAILSVDDDPLILSSLKLQLGRHFSDEFGLEFAQSAEEALEVIGYLDDDGINPVIIITDYIMPGMNGDQFARKVKEAYPNLDIIVLTGQADDNTIEMLLENLTISRLLTKPWGENELVEHVRSLIKTRLEM